MNQRLQTAVFSAKQAKQLGRTAYHPDTGILWCSLSATGIEFGFRGKECILTLTADSAYAAGEAKAARYAVYCNDTLVTAALLTEPERMVTVQNPDEEEKTAQVRLVKLSEAMMSSFGVREIRILSSDTAVQKYQYSIFVSGEKMPHLIEFIGDSITCGYGIDGQFPDEPFKTANENAAKSFAYLTAQRLHADYSMVCYSGHGIISGYTETGERMTHELVPPYYGLAGYSTAAIEGNRRIQDDLWDFAEQPDLIVLNLGTNDASYTGEDPEKQAAFMRAYVEFLKNVRKKNPSAPLLCTLGIMDQKLCDAVAQAAAHYSSETGDCRVRSMRFEMQSASDGYAVDWHPSVITHEKAADCLCREIQEWLGW